MASTVVSKTTSLSSSLSSHAKNTGISLMVKLLIYIQMTAGSVPAFPTSVLQNYKYSFGGPYNVPYGLSNYRYHK